MASRYSRKICGILFLILVNIFAVGCSAISLMRASRLDGSGDKTSAMSYYRQIIIDDPNSSSARKAMLALGDLCYDDPEKRQEAIVLYKRLIKEHPGTEEAFKASRELGFYYLENHDYQKAQELFFALFNDHPYGDMGIEAQWALSQCYEKLKDYRQAASSYCAFALLNPKHEKSPDALLNAGRIYNQELKWESKSVEAYRRVVKEYGRDQKRKQEVWLATLELRRMEAEVPIPDSAVKYRKPIRRQRIDTFSRLTKAHKGAQPSVFDSVDTDAIFLNTMAAAPGGGLGGDRPGDNSVDPKNTMLTLADTYYTAGDYLEAGAFYHQLVIRKTTDPRVFWNLGDCYAKLGLVKKAVEYYKQSAEMSSAMLDRAIIRAENEYSMKNYNGSLDILELIESVTPSHKKGRIYYDIGLAYRKLNEIDKALKSFERSLAKDPTDYNDDTAQYIAEILYYENSRLSPELRDRAKSLVYQDIAEGKVRSFEVQLELAQLCFKYESYKWAQIKYKSAAELAPDKETYMLMRVKSAVASAKAGSYDLASSELSQILTENGENAVLWYGFGEIAKGKGNLAEAVADFEKCLRLDNDCLSALTELGNCYYELGNFGKAEEVWELYLSKNPSDSVIAERLAELKACVDSH